MKTALLLISFVSFNSFYAQTEQPKNEISQKSEALTASENKTNVETKQTNNGGNKFYEYISKKVVVPSDPNFAGGKVIVEFAVQTDGSMRIDNISNDLGFGISDQIRKIFKKCKKWTPASKDGKPVEVKYSMPLIFPSNK